MDEKPDNNLFAIPANYTDSGKIFGGMLELRNAVEACFLLILAGYPELMWLPVTCTIKIFVMTVTLLPLGVLAVMGIDGDSLFQYLGHVLKFSGSRRKIHMKRVGYEENDQCKSLGEGYIRLIKDVGSREALTRRFFLIFQYEELRRGDSEDVGQVYSALQTAEQNARAYFLQCGNSIVQPADPDEAAAEILYMFFNRQSCMDEPFSERVNRVVLDTMAARGKVIGIDPVPKINVTLPGPAGH